MTVQRAAALSQLVEADDQLVTPPSVIKIVTGDDPVLMINVTMTMTTAIMTMIENFYYCNYQVKALLPGMFRAC